METETKEAKLIIFLDNPQTATYTALYASDAYNILHEHIKSKP